MIHAVWGTKNRFPFLKTHIKQRVIDHIRENALTKKIYVDTCDGDVDHMHCLFEVGPSMSVATALQLMKGEASKWINDHNITDLKFEWSDDYYARSVGESELQRVRDYINNQEEHHKKITFQEEFEKLIRRLRKG